MTLYTRVRDEWKKYLNKFPCRGGIVKYEELSQRLCFDS